MRASLRERRRSCHLCDRSRFSTGLQVRVRHSRGCGSRRQTEEKEMKYTASIPLLLLCPTGAIAATSPPPVAWQSVPPALEQVVSGVREAEGGGTIIAHILLLNASD